MHRVVYSGERTMTIDMHSHWRPSELVDALRERTKEPRILRNADGVEVLKGRFGEQPIDRAFDDPVQRLEEMEQGGISAAVLSLLGGFQWIERLPVEESLPLVRLYNDSISALCRRYEGRFAAYASLPQADVTAAAAELERAIALPGIVGAILPASAFLTYADASKMRPILEAANRHRAVLFIHYGPKPGDAFPRVPNGTDNARRRNGTLDMQANLSSAMVTLCLTDILAPYPDASIHVHNLGGNIPYEIERMDHRSMLDTPDEELPSVRFARSPVYVDCNSFGPRAIEAGVRLYGADRIMFGTDGTTFGYEWSGKALQDADIGDEAKQKILHRNAAGMMAHRVPLADFKPSHRGNQERSRPTAA
jgi:predicted TIM-barrel fold metal-dependent hydrolase